jgi:hypothetical protein
MTPTVNHTDPNRPRFARGADPRRSDVYDTIGSPGGRTLSPDRAYTYSWKVHPSRFGRPELAARANLAKAKVVT